MTLERPMFPPGPVDQLSATPGDVYLRTDVSPDAVFAALGGLRQAAEAEIERLLAFLDHLDGDADLEPAGDEDEPDLGSVEGDRQRGQDAWSAGSDAEPSLGAIERHPEPYADNWCWDRVLRDHDGRQDRWSDGAADDAEDEHDGCEPAVEDEGAPTGDDEPWLGSFDRLPNQDHAWRQPRGWSATDAEYDPAG